MDNRRTTIRPGTPRPGANYVLYWMQAYRRARQNPALDEAIRIANDLDLPVVVYEALRPDYPEANARIHTFVVEGMPANARDAAARGLRYAAYVPSTKTHDRDTLPRLARRAAVVVTDEYPAFIIPRQTRALAARIDCPLVVVDACGIVPLRELTKREWSAGTIRPKLHKLLPVYFHELDEATVQHDGTTLDLELDETDVVRESAADIVASAGVDPSVAPSPVYHGGRDAALARLSNFLEKHLSSYGVGRAQPGADTSSRLSACLHFGHVSALEVALAVRASTAPQECIDAFLEQLIVRRELAFNFTFFEPNHTSVECLPEWALKTLAKHADDEREDVSDEAIERGETYDDVWNVAQRELLVTGEIHNQPRMLWGKKIFEWSRTPQHAVDTMIRLHHRYALDGRSPLTYASILWILGLHDRAWGPERPIYGTIRYMTSESFRRKFDVPAYRKRIELAADLRK